MECSKVDKDTEWPALSEVVSAADGRHMKSVHAKSKDNKCVNGHDSSKENSKESANTNIGTRKKKNNKVAWQPLQIETPPYRKRGTGRYYNDSTKPAENDKNRRGRYESSENSRGNHRNGGFKGKRGRLYSNYQSRLEEEESISSDTLISNGFIINGVTFFPQTFSDATRKNFIKRQMEYYFSDSNLVSDVYLRLKMDNLGFVPLNIFLNFPRIMDLTRDINALTEAVEESNKLELSYHNYQLYVRRIVDPLGWKIRNAIDNGIEIPFDDSYPSILAGESIVSPVNAESSLEPADETVEPTNSSNDSLNEDKSDVPSNDVQSEYVCSNNETFVAPFSEAESNVAPIVHQMENLSLNGDASLALNTLHIEPVDAQYVPSFIEESSNTISPVTASPSEYDIELSGVYIDSKAINSGCDYYSHSVISESVEQVNGCGFYSENVYNDIIFYDSNELSNQRPVYYMVNSREVLSNSSENSNEEMLHFSPEPSR